jgi:hypothetical protein
MKYKFLAATLFFSSIALANGVPQSFVYHGKVYSQGGTTPVSGSVDAVFAILSPNGCLLYEEKQTNIDLSQTNGNLAVPVGSPVSSAVRTSRDLNLSLVDVFSNSKIIPPGANCSSGYTAQPGDFRKLHVSIAVNGGALTVLSPDIPLASVPNALIAESLQGKRPAEFAQIDTTVTQSNLDALTNGADAGALHNHDSAYVKKGDVATLQSASVSSVSATDSNAVVNKDYVTSQIAIVSQSINSTNSTVATLPTKSYVDNSVSTASVGNKSYADTAVSTAIAPLATKTYVDSSVSSAIAPLANQSDLNSLSTTVSNLPTSAAVDTKITNFSNNFADNPNTKIASKTYVASAVSAASAASSSGAPAGSLLPFAGDTCPTGYLAADGASYAIATYPSLASALFSSASQKYLWGNVDSTHFYVPDLRGQFLRGVDASGTKDPGAASRTNLAGATVGGIVGSSESDQMQGHKHSINDPGHVHNTVSDTYNPTGPYANYGHNNVQAPPNFGATSSSTTNITILGATNDGTNGNPRIGTETRPKNMAVLYCIKN